jgi:hypothetical protein
MMSTERRGPVVVIGMGRSGTSYVASLLDAAGYGLGAELKPADAANEAGYYEDLEVTHMHERRLAELGLDLGTVSERFPLPATPAVADEVRSYVTHREWPVGRGASSRRVRSSSGQRGERLFHARRFSFSRFLIPTVSSTRTWRVETPASGPRRSGCS